MELKWHGRLIRKIIKRVLYSLLCFREGILVILGLTKSYVRFTVEADPPSVFYNFKVKPEKVDDLIKHLNLPEGFSLEKMRILESDPESDYYISLNVYRVTGITNAIRAEWSVFVRNSVEPVNVVRYMVVEAQSSTLTMDPVNIFERSRRVEQSLAGDKLSTFVESFDKGYFRAFFHVPAGKSVKPVYASREWLKAIDLIYWPNGIGDRTFYDGGMACADIIAADPRQAGIEDSTQWSAFIEQVPDSVLVFPDAIDFVMSPWWNV